MNVWFRGQRFRWHLHTDSQAASSRISPSKSRAIYDKQDAKVAPRFLSLVSMPCMIKLLLNTSSICEYGEALLLGWCFLIPQKGDYPGWAWPNQEDPLSAENIPQFTGKEVRKKANSHIVNCLWGLPGKQLWASFRTWGHSWTVMAGKQIGFVQPAATLSSSEPQKGTTMQVAVSLWDTEQGPSSSVLDASPMETVRS